MHIALNTHWIEKTFLCNSRMAFLAFQFMQPKLFTHSQMKTHYDTLEISPKATHNEIKSSYYKLSMIYHPDKNKSELAKRKFQNISEAYEVLGNHQSRKRYDRSIMIKESVRTAAPKAAYKYASVYKSHTHPMGNKHFNFDVWTKKHYGERFRRRQFEARQFENEELGDPSDSDISDIPALFYVVTFIIIYICISYSLHNDYDVPKKSNNK
ncbi:hypothetical protein KPH14_008367 [Odynerus spinipes]|uniref:J domain-containing protein n=1 Tax=Odynerus spinipes TaxID=1348599 RepID=A0AAD9RUJ2_9HYME|nr:hypothetical protein KPH14_008367 [Odynerus spinipes]